MSNAKHGKAKAQSKNLYYITKKKRTNAAPPPKRRERTKKRNARNKRKKNANPLAAPVASGGGAYHLSGDVSWGIPGVFGGSIRGGMSDGAVTGSGAYKVKRNSLMSAIDLTGTVPRVKNMQKGEAFVVSNREYIKDINSGSFIDGGTTTAFTLESWNLNPSNPDLFPWLSDIASNFQEYRVTGMLVEFKTMSSDFTTALGLGTVIMTADYNVLAEPPENKQCMENMENAGSCKPSCSLIMPIECAPNQTSVSTHLYVGPLLASDGDLRLYDMCKIYLATFGIPVENAPIGELWVTYEIAFYKPKLLEFPSNQENLSWVGQWDGSYPDDPMPDDSWMGTYGEVPTLFKFVKSTDTSLGYSHVQFPNAVGQIFLVSCYWDAAATATGTGQVPGLLGANLELVTMNSSGDESLKNPLYVSGGTFVKTMSVVYLLRVTADDPTTVPIFAFAEDGDFTTATLTMMVSVWNKDFVSLVPDTASVVLHRLEPRKKIPPSNEVRTLNLKDRESGQSTQSRLCEGEDTRAWDAIPFAGALNNPVVQRAVTAARPEPRRNLERTTTQ